MTHYRKRGYRQRGGADLRELTEKIYNEPWSLSKPELQTLVNLSPEEFAANAEGVTPKTAAMMIEVARDRLNGPEPEPDDGSKMTAAEAKIIADMEARVAAEELAGSAEQTGGNYCHSRYRRVEQRGSALTKAQLKQMAMDYGIDCSGNKAELCDRVLNALFPEEK